MDAVSSTPAASTTLRPSGFAWQACPAKFGKRSGSHANKKSDSAKQDLYEQAKRALRSSIERSGAN